MNVTALIAEIQLLVLDSFIYGSNVYQTCIGSESVSSWIIWQTAAYYATVEQQGRLTLHLHMLLWIPELIISTRN